MNANCWRKLTPIFSENVSETPAGGRRSGFFVNLALIYKCLVTYFKG